MIGVVVDLINIIRDDICLALKGARQMAAGLIVMVSALTVALLAVVSIPVAPLIWIAERSHHAQQNK